MRQPETGVYLLLWVDHHDEAMDWAANKKFVWNEFVSSFQIVPVVQAAPVEVPPVEIQSQNLPFTNNERRQSQHRINKRI